MRWSRSHSARIARRGLSGAVVGVILLAATVSVTPVFAAPLARISAVPDFGPSPAAEMVRQSLPRYLAAEFGRAGAPDFPPGSRLELGIREIYLSQDGGQPYGVANDFGPMPDAITGVMRILDPRGKVLAERRAYATSSPDAGGLGPDNERRRVDALLRALAYWVARDLAP